jgi:hypothetical protein
MMNRADKSDLTAKLAEQALILAAVTPWNRVSLSDICRASEVALAECARVHVTKSHVVARLDGLIDQGMLSATGKIDTTQSVRDRLFDVLMGRFDVMEDQREAWTSILNADKNDTLASLARRTRRAVSGAWALEAAGINSGDFGGAGKAVALARILRLVEDVWLEDGPELAKTMARLDQELRTGEEWVERIAGLRGFFRAKPATEPQL